MEISPTEPTLGRPRKALVIGFYESTNVGDLALSNAIDRLLRKRGFEVIPYDFSTARRVHEGPAGPSPQLLDATSRPGSLAASRLSSLIEQATRSLLGAARAETAVLLSGKILRAKAWKTFASDLCECDVVVLAGGNMIMDLHETWPARIAFYCHEARRHRKPVHVMYVGVGPISKSASTRLLRRALNYASTISVRDQPSSRLCATIADRSGITESADPVFSLDIDLLDERLARVSRPPTPPVLQIGICVLGRPCFTSSLSHERYSHSLLRLLTAIAQKVPGNKRFALFSTETRDYESVRSIQVEVQRRADDAVYIRELRTVADTVEFYRELDFLVGGRMHSMIIAHKCLLPHCGIVWQEKIRGYGQLVGLSSEMYEPAQLVAECETVASKILERSRDGIHIQQMHARNAALAAIVNRASPI